MRKFLRNLALLAFVALSILLFAWGCSGLTHKHHGKAPCCPGH